jgi:hypothetical protein
MEAFSDRQAQAALAVTVIATAELLVTTTLQLTAALPPIGMLGDTVTPIGGGAGVIVYHPLSAC